LLRIAARVIILEMNKYSNHILNALFSVVLCTTLSPALADHKYKPAEGENNGCPQYYFGTCRSDPNLGPYGLKGTTNKAGVSCATDYATSDPCGKDVTAGDTSGE
jgi:hypothetical protein